LFNGYIAFKILRGRPNFVLFSDSTMLADPVKRLCGLLGCDVIDFFGDAPANTTASRCKVPYEVDYVLTGYPLSKLYPNIDEKKILEIRQGPPADFAISDDERQERDIDLLVFGSFDSDIFRRRSEMVDAFLSTGAASDLNVKVIGSIRQEEEEFIEAYPNLASRIEPPRGGEAFRELLHRAKIAINIPADQHIQIGSQRPKGIFECAASRTMQLHYETAAVSEIFHSNEIVQFEDVNELIDSIEYYLDNEAERNMITDNAFERFRREYTAETQIQRVFWETYDW
jgi:spore maturation protein CgeB